MLYSRVPETRGATNIRYGPPILSKVGISTLVWSNSALVSLAGVKLFPLAPGAPRMFHMSTPGKQLHSYVRSVPFCQVDVANVGMFFMVAAHPVVLSVASV